VFDFRLGATPIVADDVAVDLVARGAAKVVEIIPDPEPEVESVEEVAVEPEVDIVTDTIDVASEDVLNLDAKPRRRAKREKDADDGELQAD